MRQNGVMIAPPLFGDPTVQAPSTPPSAPRLRVGFILTRRFTLCAFANFVDVLRLAADEGDGSRPILCGWRVLSTTTDPVISSSGIAVQPEERLGDPARFDYIVVVGGLMQELEYLDPDHAEFLHRAAQAGVPLVGVCTGAFVLHRAGLLQGYRCCVSWFHHNDFLEQFDGIKPVSDQIFVVDRDRLTCSGGTSSAHLAAFLVDRHIGRAASKKSLAIMMIDEAMAAERPQPGLPLELSTADPLVRKALLTIQQRLEHDAIAGEHGDPPCACRTSAVAERAHHYAGGPGLRVCRCLPPDSRLQDGPRHHARGLASKTG